MTIVETKLDESPHGQHQYYMSRSKRWLVRELIEKNRQLRKLLDVRSSTDESK